MGSSKQSVIVLGGSGFIGSRVQEMWADELDAVAPTHAQVDVLDGRALAAFLEHTNVPTVLNLAAWADVDGAEAERNNIDGRVYALNVKYPETLARLCGELGKHLLHVSTDYVFDGTSAERPYTEQDATRPLGWYAETKLRGERCVLGSGASACVARIEMPFSGRDFRKRDLARLCASRLRSGQTFIGVADQRITPVYVDDAVRAFKLLIQARQTGIVHVASTDWTTPYRFAQSIARRLGLDTDLVQPEDFVVFAATRPAQRPQHSWLDVSRFVSLIGPDVLRPVDEQLDAWVDQLFDASSRV